MRYCTRCILPDTRPGITIGNDGICSACGGHDIKEREIDWVAREEEFQRIIADAKSRSSGYDCIVPVSGGKDSWYQVICCKEAGLKVLAVTWRTPARTAIGQTNLENMVVKLGVDHIDYTINPEVERRFMTAAYEEKGATGIPMHMALFAIPIRLAVQLQIPLVVWGENPQLEFGGERSEQFSTVLDAEWLSRHGCLQSTAAADWVGKQGLTAKDMVAYALPDAGAKGFSPRSIFLGALRKWNSFENARIAEEHGFKQGAEFAKTGVWGFADIDCGFISLHHFLKWYKFGITRAFDNLSVQIRYGLTSRQDAIDIIRNTGLQVPADDISRFCEFVGKPVSWFWDVAERYRDHRIWSHEGGRWHIPGFLVEDWKWD